MSSGYFFAYNHDYQPHWTTGVNRNHALDSRVWIDKCVYVVYVRSSFLVFWKDMAIVTALLFATLLIDTIFP